MRPYGLPDKLAGRPRCIKSDRCRCVENPKRHLFGSESYMAWRRSNHILSTSIGSHGIDNLTHFFVIVRSRRPANFGNYIDNSHNDGDV